MSPDPLLPQEDVLFVRVYSELRELARSMMAGEPDQTLQPTALVHEVWMRLEGGGAVSGDSRAAFFGAAARAMRRVLVDKARERRSLKRGGDRRRRDLDEYFSDEGPTGEELLALDAALERFERREPRAARVVSLRTFGGLEVTEVSELLEVSVATVKRDWVWAKAWLYEEIERELAGPTA